MMPGSTTSPIAVSPSQPTHFAPLSSAPSHYHQCSETPGLPRVRTLIHQVCVAVVGGIKLREGIVDLLGSRVPLLGLGGLLPLVRPVA